MNINQDILDALLLCEAIALEHPIDNLGLGILCKVRDRIADQLPDVCDHGVPLIDDTCSECRSPYPFGIKFHIGDSLCATIIVASLRYVAEVLS